MLKFNICNFQDLFILYEDMRLGNPEDRGCGHITEALRYACTYWPMHLARTSPSDESYESIIKALKKFLFTAETDGDEKPLRGNHLIHWIEALSIIGHVDSAKMSMRALFEWSKV